jgi:hypothetical protein
MGRHDGAEGILGDEENGDGVAGGVDGGVGIEYIGEGKEKEEENVVDRDDAGEQDGG